MGERAKPQVKPLNHTETSLPEGCVDGGGPWPGAGGGTVSRMPDERQELVTAFNARRDRVERYENTWFRQS